MDLRELISGNKGQEFLWSLVIEPGWVQAGIWTIVGEEAKVVSISNPVAWETEAELVTSCDTALSSAVQTLPENTKEPNKVVFGVSASWVSQGQIKKEKLDLLKEVCTKLTLKPSGFVTLPEAVSFYVKSKDGSPLTAVLISPGKELLEVSVFRLGNLSGTTQVARSVSIFDDVIEGLSRFKSDEPYPSRFILFDGKEGELEEAKQALLTGSWAEVTKVKLLHTPKVEVLSGEEKIEAVSLGGATEIASVSKINMLNQVKEVEEELTSPDDLKEAQNVGFVVEADETEVKDQAQKLAEDQPVRKINIPAKPKELFQKVVGLVSRISTGGKRPVLVGTAAFIIVAVGLVAFWWFFPKASVTIYISPQKLDQKETVTVDLNSTQSSFENKVLPGRKISQEESGEKTISTTGNKTVGEKATGEVEIRNGTSDALDLKAGTSIISGNTLEFKTTKDVTIDAQSSPGSPGTGSVEVEAADIGSEYNLPKDELFKVGSYPKAEVDAKALADFSGGASRQIKAIGEEDRTRILEELTQELADKAKDTLATSVGEDEFFIEGSTSSGVVSQNYSGKVGDEADNLSLDLTIDVSGAVVSKVHLFEFAQKLLDEKIPDGYILRETQLTYEFSLAEGEQKDNQYVLEGEISANLLPEVDTEQIESAIVGKYPPVALEFMQKIPGFVRAQINIKPRFPGKLGTLPKVRENIEVELAADR